MATPEQFAAQLLAAAAEAPVVAKAVVGKGSLSIKNTARDNVLRSAPVHSGGAERAINYDVEVAGSLITGEIGYDRRNRAGRIGNLLEYGGGGDHSPPHRDLGRALDDEDPKFRAAMVTAIAKLL